MRPHFGLRIPPCRALTEVAACVRDAEQAGFDVAWLPDSQFLWRDVWGAPSFRDRGGSRKHR